MWISMGMIKMFAALQSVKYSAWFIDNLRPVLEVHRRAAITQWDTSSLES